MDIENIERANKLVERVEALENFTRRVYDKGYNKARVKMILKVKKTHSYSIFGTRAFWSGRHEQEIQIPPEIFDKVVEEAVLIKKELEDEIKTL